MTIIEIKRFNEIRGKVHGFVAEPSPEAAAIDFEQIYGYKPRTIYYKRTASGRCTVYCQVEEE